MKTLKNKFMKSSLIIFIVSLIIGIILFIVFSKLDISGIKDETDSKLNGNLFDMVVLDRYELSWLEKPKNIENEKQYINQERSCYVYECDFQEVMQAETYVESTFNSSILKNYTLAYLLHDNSAYQDTFNRVKISENIADYRNIENNIISYTFYYSSKEKETLTSLAEGLNIGCLSVLFELNNEVNENGRYTFYIKLHKTSSYNVAVSY